MQSSSTKDINDDSKLIEPEPEKEVKQEVKKNKVKSEQYLK
jgi:hypothetical protein